MADTTSWLIEKCLRSVILSSLTTDVEMEQHEREPGGFRLVIYSRPKDFSKMYPSHLNNNERALINEFSS